MRILFVQKEGGIFGAENFQLKIIPGLIACGFTIEFLRLYTSYQGGKGGRFIELLNGLGVKTYEINIGRWPKPSNLVKINRIIQTGNYDMIHTHLIHADFHLALVKMIFNRKLRVVSTKHGYDNDFTARHGFSSEKQGLTPYFLISKFSEQWMNKSYTITHALHNFFIQTGLTSSRKMSMIHYGFDFQDPDKNWADKAFKRFEKQLVIAGRLVRFKGHRFVIESLPAVIEKYPEAGLVIVGSGEMEVELKMLVRTLKIQDHVVFTGYSTEVPKWMYNSDIVLVPSVSEGFGVVLLEAFNCSKPVVAFNVAACNELIEHGVSGFLIEPFNIQEMSDRIRQLLDAPELGNQVARAAHAKLKDYFNLKRMVNETIEFYNRV